MSRNENIHIQICRDMYWTMKKANPDVPKIHTVRAMGNIFIESDDGKLKMTIPDTVASLWDAKMEGIMAYKEQFLKGKD